MSLQINIDNGGTLTDICIMSSSGVSKTKVLTTPYDLSKCFFEGLQKASGVIYGAPNVGRLLEEVDVIRYSTTQGTNAICERKGPRLGLIHDAAHPELPKQLADKDPEVYEALVGQRVVALSAGVVRGEDAEVELVKAINQLTAMGANRLVVSFGGEEFTAIERTFRSIVLRKYPRHLLGAVPVLYGSDVASDRDHVRRTWTALINSFLHPAMEHFLYNAENRLRSFRTRNPLLIFRNDGDASRVAKTVAIKTYSSGPRGGMEGLKAFARQYGLPDVIAIDVGGTTTDIAQSLGGVVQEVRRGHVEGISVSLPLCEIMSAGVGGSSVIRANGGIISIGPESVGAVPGPACFGRGGKEATITDASLLAGLLDPASYFGGGMGLDAARAATAVTEHIARPLGLALDEALRAMEQAYEEKIAREVERFATVGPKSVLLAFGGAGPMNACGVAEKAGIRQVMVPHLAAVFSAYGIGSCNVSQRYSAAVPDAAPQSLRTALAELRARARRDMYAEGCEEGDYDLAARLVGEGADGGEVGVPLDQSGNPQEPISGVRNLEIELDAVKRMRGQASTGATVTRKGKAASAATRRILGRDLQRTEVPVYRLADLKDGDVASGPAILEEDYFTCRVLDGWTFAVSSAGDILLTHGE